MIHRLIARFGLRFRHGPVPSFQMAKGLLYISPSKFGLDGTAGACRAIYPVLLKGGLNAAGDATSAYLTKAAGAT
jgi:hypothetical protein